MKLRGFFRIHLNTALLLQFVLMLIVTLNFQKYYSHHATCSTDETYGWPFEIVHYFYYGSDDHPLLGRVFSWGGLVLNGLCTALMLAGLRFALWRSTANTSAADLHKS